MLQHQCANELWFLTLLCAHLEMHVIHTFIGRSPGTTLALTSLDASYATWNSDLAMSLLEQPLCLIQ
jgi:hypothetical protein